MTDFWKWLEDGVEKGWVSVPVCSTHDSVPMTEEEWDEWEDGSDPCIHVIRLWPDGAPEVTK